MTASGISVSELTAAQDRWTSHWHEGQRVPEPDGWLALVEENHWHNFSLWHEEDKARRTDAGHELIYHAKRAIDQHNQLRNNAMEKMDGFLLERLQPREEAPLNSETPGMMIDRLSILSLKEYHMAEEAERADASDEHRRRCAEKLTVIRTQRVDLAGVLSDFLAEVRNGRRRFKVYFQFKMYNDPTLNPELYRRGSGSGGQA